MKLGELKRKLEWLDDEAKLCVNVFYGGCLEGFADDIVAVDVDELGVDTYITFIYNSQED